MTASRPAPSYRQMRRLVGRQPSSGGWRAVSATAALTLLTSILQVVPAGLVAHAATPKAPVDVSSRPDQVSASQAARALKHKVEISGMGSESSTVWANPDGSTTMSTTAGVSRWKSDDDLWHQIDTTLAVGGDGSLSPASQSPHRRLVIPANALAAAHVMTARGDFALTHPGASNVPVTRSRSRGKFAKALGGRDLAEDATVNGLEETVTLADFSQSGSWTDAITVPTGVIAKQSGGKVNFVDSSGAVVSSFGGGGA